MATEKRKLDGSKIGPNEKYEGKTLDWDTDLGGPIVKVPKESEPKTDASQPVSKHRKNSGAAKTRAKTARTAQSDTSSQPATRAESSQPETGSDAAQ
jgi:hypothetical protein